MIDIVSTTAEHIHILADTIRDNDRREIESYGFSVMKGLWRSFKGGNFNKTAFIDGKLAACWGCGGSLMGSVGIPWLITSSHVETISPIKMARMYRKEVDNMLQLFPVLSNYVLADYHEAVRLLSLCGFQLGEPERLGTGGMYRKFELRS